MRGGGKVSLTTLPSANHKHMSFLHTDFFAAHINVVLLSRHLWAPCETTGFQRVETVLSMSLESLPQQACWWGMSSGHGLESVLGGLQWLSQASPHPPNPFLDPGCKLHDPHPANCITCKLHHPRPVAHWLPVRFD